MSTYEIKDVQIVSNDRISALDLADQLRKEGDAECALVTLRRVGASPESQEAEGAQVIYYPALGRGACAWGADAIWTDASSLRDVAERVIVTGEVI